MRLEYEIIYKIKGSREVTAEEFPNSMFELDEVELTDLKRGQLALKGSLEVDEEDVWEGFSEKIASDGPDGFYFKARLLDDEGNEIDIDEHVDSNGDIKPSF